MECDQDLGHTAASDDSPEYDPFATAPERERGKTPESTPTRQSPAPDADDAVAFVPEVSPPWEDDSWVSIPVPADRSCSRATPESVTEDFTVTRSVSSHSRASQVATNGESVTSVPTLLPPGECPICLPRVIPYDSESRTMLGTDSDNEDARADPVREEASERRWKADDGSDDAGAQSDLSVTETIHADGGACGLAGAEESPWWKELEYRRYDENGWSLLSPSTPPAPEAAELAPEHAALQPLHPEIHTSTTSPQSCEQGRGAPDPVASLETTPTTTHICWDPPPYEGFLVKLRAIDHLMKELTAGMSRPPKRARADG